jgi:hypothetical protein
MIGMAEVKSVMPQAHLDHGRHLGHGDYHGEIADHHEGRSQPWKRR